jgi:uncharacterized iron-regulated membrane protein
MAGGRETGVTLLRPSVEDLFESVEDGERLRLGMRVLSVALALAVSLMIVVGVVMWSTRGEAGEMRHELDQQRVSRYHYVDVVSEKALP